MSTHLYLDCFSGVSGNMLLGALIDLGVPETYIQEVIEKLGIEEDYSIEVNTKNSHAIMATLVTVRYGHSHHHRKLNDIVQLLKNGSLPSKVVEQATDVFHGLALAEAKVHGTTIDQIHFHEVGAIDAIIDIVGTVAAIHYLQVDEITCSPLPMPTGWVKCEHGEIPLPAPAVCNLLEEVPVYGEPLQQELVTPTGAALVVSLASNFGPIPSMTLKKTGYGAGTMQRKDHRPNLLRAQLGRQLIVDEEQAVEVLDTHIDDWNPELWPYTSEKLMRSGALDVSLIPIQMKKGRPGYLLRVICAPLLTPRLSEIIFAETSSIGIRRRREYRTTLPREVVTVMTKWGEVQAKKIRSHGRIELTPEYESCKKVAMESDVALKEVYAAVAACTIMQGDETDG